MSYTTATKADLDTMVRICKRFEDICSKRGVRLEPRLARLMDLEAAHASRPLDLPALEQAEDVDFVHDVGGITQHMDRESGTLQNCFVPRFARLRTLAG